MNPVSWVNTQQQRKIEKMETEYFSLFRNNHRSTIIVQKYSNGKN